MKHSVSALRIHNKFTSAIQLLKGRRQIFVERVVAVCGIGRWFSLSGASFVVGLGASSVAMAVHKESRLYNERDYRQSNSSPATR